MNLENEILPKDFDTALVQGLKDFKSLDTAKKKQIILRANKVLEDINGLELNEDITLKLANSEKVRDRVVHAIPQKSNEANLILRMLYDTERTDEVEDAIEWLEELMRMLRIELDMNKFTNLEMINFWMPELVNRGIAQATNEDGKPIQPNPPILAEGIFWNLARARAYVLYGVKLGFYWSRDEIGATLDYYSRICKELKLEELTKEFDDLNNLISFRMGVDSNDIVLISHLSIVSGISLKAVSNASVKGEEDGYLIPYPKNQRKDFEADSAERWLLDRKKNKYEYLSSVIVEEESHWDGHATIPTTNKKELIDFIEENSQFLD